MSVKMSMMCRENRNLNFTKLFQWFHYNYDKANSGQHHVILTTDHSLKINAKGSLFRKEKTVKLLEMTVDIKLFFEPHLNKICKNVSQKK